MISTNFAPSYVEINSLGIGLLNYSNIDTLDLTTDEYLVVGENQSVGDTAQDIKYSLIVNKDGVGVNTTRRFLNAINSNSIQTPSLYVDSDIICDGNIIARGLEFANITFGGPDSNILQNLVKSISDINPLFYKGYDVQNDQTVSLPNADNIWTPSFVTIGSASDTFNNTNPLNIVATANNNINNVHLSINNNTNSVDNEQASLRIGMIGGAADSPAVISTTTGMPIHFHVGKNTRYMNTLYEEQTGYPNFSFSNLPSLVIDSRGNVGIGATETDLMTFRKYNKIENNNIVPNSVSEYSKLKIFGNAFIQNILTYDYYTSSNLHLDDIYIRKLGQNFEANQIIPGQFNRGVFTFNSNLYVGQSNANYTLEVNNILNVNGNLTVSEKTTLNDVIINQATFNNTTVFDNDITITQDVILGGNIKVNKGDLFFGKTRINISELQPFMIDKDVANELNIDNGSNILFFANNDMVNLSNGSNLVVPGRLGAGVLSKDEYNEQFNVIKREQFTFELALQDSSDGNTSTHTPTVYMGHLNTLGTINLTDDRSFIINTNQLDTIHNIYFFPGTDLIRRNIRDNIPTLSVNQNNKVGINTKVPRHTLDVNGDFICNDIYISKNNNENKALLFVMKKPETSLPLDFTRALYYLYDENIQKYCINFADDSILLKGLNVKGGIHSTNDGYYENGVKLATLKMINSTNTMAYTHTHLTVGYNIGDNYIGDKPLSLRNIQNRDYNDTILRLFRGNDYGGARTNSAFTGIDFCDYQTQPNKPDRTLYKWFMYKNHILQTAENVGPLQIGYTDGTHRPIHSGMTIFYNNITSNYHIDVNNPRPNNILNQRKNAMAIYGGLDVYGDINIIGSSNQYKINGIAVSPNAISGLQNSSNNSSSLPQNTQGQTLNDVVITGKKIAIMPDKTLAVGRIDNGFINYLNTIENNENYSVPLTIYQNNANQSVCRLLSSENTTLPQNTATLELGILNTIDNNYEGITKNTMKFKVSNYSQSDRNKTVFDICAYNISANTDDKLMSIYYDENTSYVNIGYKNNVHSTDGSLSIKELNNVALHVENPSTYLLQLTNSTKAPVISMHRNDTDNDKFWLLEAPDNNGNFVLKNSHSTNSYLPESSNTKTAFVVTRDNKIGINKTLPEYVLDVKSQFDTSAISITNVYDDFRSLTNYATVEIINSNIQFKKITEYKTSNIQYNNLIDTYDTATNTFYSGLKNYIDSSNIPSTYTNGDLLPLEFVQNSNFFNETTLDINKIIMTTSQHNFNLTSNNEHISFSSDGYTNNYNFNFFENKTFNFELSMQNTSISLLPILPDLNNIELTIDDNDIQSENIIINKQLYIPSKSEAESNPNNNQSIIPTISVPELNSIRLQYNYNIGMSLLTSKISNYRHDIEEPRYQIIDRGDFQNRDIYTSNTINTYLDYNNTGLYTNNYLLVSCNFQKIEYKTPERSLAMIYNHYIITSNVFHYNINDTYDINIIADVNRFYKYYGEASGPSTIINTNHEFSVVDTYEGDNLNKKVYLRLESRYLNTVPYGVYDGFDFADNIIMTQVNKIEMTDTFEILGNTFRHFVTLTDYYSTYRFTDNIQRLYIFANTIDYKPHIVFQNTIDFNQNTDTVYGKTNKIYSKNGAIEFVSEDAVSKNVMLRIDDSGALIFDGTIYANNLVFKENIFDRLGNSVIIDYNENMYDKAFVMQSSNYILHTSNYNIHSTSNISFFLKGKAKQGLVIVKEDIYNQDSSLNNYDLFRIYEAEKTALIVKNGGKIGIKTDVPRYELDINGDMYVSNIMAEYFIGNGSQISNVNLRDKSTADLKEGSNLYYTPERCGIICHSSNLETSNYIRNTSNELNHFIIQTDANMSNYLYETCNILDIKIDLLDGYASNYVREYVEFKDTNISNLVHETSNVINSYVRQSDINMSNILTEYIDDNLSYTSNVITDSIISLDSNVSNYIYESSNIIYDVINKNNENISNYVYKTLDVFHDKINYVMEDILDTSNDIIENLLIYDANASNYILETKSYIMEQILGDLIINTDSSISVSSNNLIEYIDFNLIKNSNSLNQTITKLDGNISNYISTTIVRDYIELNDTNLSNYIGLTTDSINERLIATTTATNLLIDTLSTDTVKEGTLNRYYTDARFDQRLGSKTLDDINQGLANKFIQNNKFDVDGANSFTIVGNVEIRGTLTTTGSNVQLTTSTGVNTALKIDGSTPDVSFEIVRSDAFNDLVKIQNVSFSPAKNDIFHIRNNGNIGIGTYPSESSPFLLHVNGAFLANTIHGDGSAITGLSTTNITEGSKLFYTPERVNSIVNPQFSVINSNIQTIQNNLSSTISENNFNVSNYVSRTSMDNYVFASLVGTNTSNYVMNTSNNHVASSNNLISNILLNSVNTSNYVRLSSNNVIGYASNLDVISSNYTKSVGDLLGIRITDTSNYVRLSSNAVIGYSSNLNIISSNYTKSVGDALGIRVNDTSNYIRLSSNNAIGYSSNIGIISSNYTKSVGDTLGIRITDTSNYVRLSSNNVIGYASNLDINVSNYITRISDITTTTSNNITRDLNTLATNTTAGISNTSNYILTVKSQTMLDVYNSDSNVSNFVYFTSNILDNKSKGYAVRESEIVYNLLFGYITDGDRNVSNVVMQNVRVLDSNCSNYVKTGYDVLFGSNISLSNYIMSASNDAIRFTSNVSNSLIENIRSVSNNVVGLTIDTVSQNKIKNLNNDIEFQTGVNVFVRGNVNVYGDVISSYSDIRLKNIIGTIDNPIDSIMKINTFKYEPNDTAKSLGIMSEQSYVGLSAQDVLSVLPECVSLAPFDACNLVSGDKVSKSGSNYLSVSYERLVPLLIECIKELNTRVKELEQKLI